MNLLVYRRFTDPKGIGVNLESYESEFSFISRMHREQRDALLALFDDPDLRKRGLTSTLVADMIAAAIAQLLTTKRAYHSVTLKALRFARDQLLDMGFHETNETRIVEHARGADLTLMLIAGCQGRRTIRSRAFAAADLLRSGVLSPPVRMFGCGWRPLGLSKPQIPEESARVENLILERLREPGLAALAKIKTATIHLESKSQTTEENIAKFLATTMSDRLWSQKVNVFLVSSTWHLAKLARCFEVDVAKHSLGYNALVLVGAEPLDEINDTSEDVRYAKQALFRLYSHVAQMTLQETGAMPTPGEVRRRRQLDDDPAGLPTAG